MNNLKLLLVALFFQPGMLAAQEKKYYGPTVTLKREASPTSNSSEQPTTRSIGAAMQFLNAQGNWVSDDAFIDPSSDKMILSNEAKDLIQLIRGLLRTYGIKDSPRTKVNSQYHFNSFFESMVINHAIYRYVESEAELKQVCHTPDLDKPKPGEPKRLYGCTDQDGATYLIRDRFNQFDLRHQVLGVIHERLHAWCSMLKPETEFSCEQKSEGHEWLKDFVSVIHTVLDVYQRQAAIIATSGNLFPLTDKEMAAIGYAATAAHTLGFQTDGFNYQVYRNGGGILLSPKTATIENSYLGIGTVVGFQSNIQNVIALNSNVAGTFIQSKIINSTVHLFSGTVVDSEIRNSTVSIGSGNYLTRIIPKKYVSYLKEYIPGIKNSKIEGSTLTYVSVTDSNLQNFNADNSYLNNLNVSKAKLSEKPDVSESYIEDIGIKRQYIQAKEATLVRAEIADSCTVSSTIFLPGSRCLGKTEVKGRQSLVVEEGGTLENSTVDIMNTGSKRNRNAIVIPSGVTIKNLNAYIRFDDDSRYNYNSVFEESADFSFTLEKKCRANIGWKNVTKELLKDCKRNQY